MSTRLIALWDALRGSYWLVPLAMTLAAVGLAMAALRVDEVWPEAGRGLGLVGPTPEGARATLSTIAGAMITIAGLTFSITIVALSVTTSQFGPRLLRNLMRDTGNQVVLGTFVATFVYSALVLGAIRSGAEEAVPALATTLGLVLALASLGVLIYFIHHVSASLHASRVIHAVGLELDGAIGKLFPDLAEDGAADAAPEVPEIDGEGVIARRSGYLQAIDDAGLTELARRRDLVVRLEFRPGDYVTCGAVIATVAPAADEAVCAAIDGAFVLGEQRTSVQDLEFSITQLVEVAVRALSPSVNDPFTAIACIDRLGVSLGDLARRRITPPHRRDGDGRLRVVGKAWSFGGAVDTACDLIRQYGRGSAAVAIRLLEMLAVVADRVRSAEDGAAVMRQASMVDRGSEALPEAIDRDEVHRRYQVVREKLARRGGERRRGNGGA